MIIPIETRKQIIRDACKKFECLKIIAEEIVTYASSALEGLCLARKIFTLIDPESDKSLDTTLPVTYAQSFQVNEDDGDAGSDLIDRRIDVLQMDIEELETKLARVLLDQAVEATGNVIQCADGLLEQTLTDVRQKMAADGLTLALVACSHPTQIIGMHKDFIDIDSLTLRQRYKSGYWATCFNGTCGLVTKSVDGGNMLPENTLYCIAQDSCKRLIVEPMSLKVDGEQFAATLTYKHAVVESRGVYRIVLN